MENYLLSIKYDGYNYFGWAKQKNQITIQGELEKALYKLTNKDVWTLGASRTDKKVHARDQKCLIKLPFFITPNNLKRHLNGRLPNDIYVFSVKKIKENFNIRKTKKKIYKYFLIHKRDVFKAKHNYFVEHDLNTSRINEACKLFLGQKNFYNFCKNKKNENINFNREITKLKFIKYKNHSIFTIEGPSFIRCQIRMIIGTILAYHDEIIDLKYIKNRFTNTLDNQTTKYIVPGEGLYLYKIYF